VCVYIYTHRWTKSGQPDQEAASAQNQSSSNSVPSIDPAVVKAAAAFGVDAAAFGVDAAAFGVDAAAFGVDSAAFGVDSAASGVGLDQDDLPQLLKAPSPGPFEAPRQPHVCHF
jgi:hypothetical protein